MKHFITSLIRGAHTVVVPIALVSSSVSQAATFLRWTKSDLPNAQLESIVEAAKQKTGFDLKAADFVLDEERDLAFNHYRRYSQMLAGVRAKGAGIRIWTDGGLVQAEANVEDPTELSTQTRLFLNLHRTAASGLKDLATALDSTTTHQLARNAIASSEDPSAIRFVSADFIEAKRLVREVTITAKHGKHIVTIDLRTRKVIKSKYVPFPTGDQDRSFSVNVFPVYEEYKGTILGRKSAPLKNLVGRVQRPSQDPFLDLRNSQRFLYSKYDALKALTPEGQAEGYWSDRLLRQKIQAAVSTIPFSNNTFTDGLLLQGKYATININPEAITKFPGIGFTPAFSSHAFWLTKDVEIGGEADGEVIPSATYFNKSFASARELYNAPATHDPNHNPELYLNEGFDQIQVYYAIDKLFEVLHRNGFKDPELSTRPFHAILYDPDISMRDNAYYNADTINFTTYSEANMARDNTTIWHELGHGVMDRLMGEVLNLADTGGLSEGMADFVAALVLEGAVGSADFPGKQDQRIINKTGFYLTNEVHDDGESYGGSMKDILDAVLRTWPSQGLAIMTDLTFETMRLTRDHPALTADEWFSHMIFADSLGRKGLRSPGQVKGIITQALASRNFFKTAEERGKLSLRYAEKEVEAGEPGSRGNGIPLTLDPAATQDLAIKLSVEDGDKYKFTYPLTLRAYFRTGPLQGAVHWEGEEATYKDITVNAPGEEHELPLKVSGTCDFVNREDGSCVDFVYVHILAPGETTAVAKKRFYVKVTPKKP